MDKRITLAKTICLPTLTGGGGGGRDLWGRDINSKALLANKGKMPKISKGHSSDKILRNSPKVAPTKFYGVPPKVYQHTSSPICVPNIKALT